MSEAEYMEIVEGEFGRSVQAGEVFVSDEDLKSVGVDPEKVSDDQLIDIAEQLIATIRDRHYERCLKECCDKVLKRGR